MIGVFSNIIHKGVSWDKSSAMISQEVHRKSTRPDKPRIETRPVKFGWSKEGNKKSSTLVAVYAAVEYIAEVKGICMRLAYEKTDKEGVGLLGSQFHTTDNLQRTINTRIVILSTHERFVSKHSICTISAETHNLNVRATTNLCKALLTTTLHSAKNIQT